MDILAYLANKVTGNKESKEPPVSSPPPVYNNDDPLRNMAHRGTDLIFDRSRQMFDNSLFREEMRRDMEQFNAEFEEMRKMMGPVFRDMGGELDKIGSLLGDPRDNVNSNFTSTSISITTNDDGTLQEKRTVTTIGPDGVPKEETTVTNLGQQQSPMSIMMSHPVVHEPKQVQSPRDQFLTGHPIPSDEPSGQTRENVASFRMPDYAKDFSEKIDSIIRPYK